MQIISISSYSQHMELYHVPTQRIREHISIDSHVVESTWERNQATGMHPASI